MDKNFRIRLGVSYLCIAALGTGVMVRAGVLMLMPSERLESAMNRQFRQEPPRMPRRGYMVDRNKESIAVSMEVKSLFANPGKIKNKQEVAERLGKLLHMPVAQVKQKLKSDKGFTWIKRQLNQQEQEAVLKSVRAFFAKQRLDAEFLGETGDAAERTFVENVQKYR